MVDPNRQRISLSLERVKSCLNYLGNPQKRFKSVLIGGTNGKGSVTYYLSQLASNFTELKIGRYISPHLVSLNERFVINEKPVEDSLLKEVSEAVVEKIKQFEEKSNTSLTEFEVYTIIAFYLFAHEKVDIVFLEIGLGGRLDATNIVDSKDVLCSIITNISFDHMEYLGNTIEEIAHEKAGIIKENNYVISAAEKPAIEVISDRAKKFNAELLTIDTSGCKFYKDKNIKLALIAWDLISSRIANVRAGNYKEFLSSLQFPGRFQFFEDQKIVLDGAHNPSAAIELRKLIENKFSDKKVIYIIGMLDKDYEGFLKNLIPEGSTVVCTEPHSNRKTSKELISNCVLKCGSKAITAPDIKSAIDIARRKEHDIIVITGSLYLVGEALNVIARSNFVATKQSPKRYEIASSAHIEPSRNDV